MTTFRTTVRKHVECMFSHHGAKTCRMHVFTPWCQNMSQIFLQISSFPPICLSPAHIFSLPLSPFYIVITSSLSPHFVLFSLPTNIFSYKYYHFLSLSLSILNCHHSCNHFPNIFYYFNLTYSCFFIYLTYF